MKISNDINFGGGVRPMTTGMSLGTTHFSKVLAMQDTAADRQPETREQMVRQTAEELVATALVKPLLEQMRNDPFKSDLFDGGQAEEAFGAQMDTIMADRMVQGMRLTVVEGVYRTLMQRGQLEQGSKVNVVR